MSKVGIIGDKDTVMGFLALGIDIFPAYSAEEIKKQSISWQKRNMRLFTSQREPA